MELFCRKLGKGDPLIILHGLYGSSDNWYTIGRELAADHTVYLVDQRNHGNSPSHPVHNYQALTGDLREFMAQHHVNRPVIIGHSMGGKAALAFGLNYPEMVRKIIVVDISPLGYFSDGNMHEITGHERIISALQTIDPGTLANRREADLLLKKYIAPPAIRQFLLKNLKHNSDGGFYWAINLPVIAENMHEIFSGLILENEHDPRSIARFPLLFIRGEYSHYIRKKDEKAIRHYFPWSNIVTVQGTGHWLHAEEPASFLRIVREFIAEVS
ncbi:MAG TPA: alpha/beta fold hydrolase [Bacteroidales bacterium]|nr:alpha/beta fold hydrolase [Bacteroidales bacterium]